MEQVRRHRLSRGVSQQVLPEQLVQRHWFPVGPGLLTLFSFILLPFSIFLNEEIDSRGVQNKKHKVYLAFAPLQLPEVNSGQAIKERPPAGGFSFRDQGGEELFISYFFIFEHAWFLRIKKSILHWGSCDFGAFFSCFARWFVEQ